MNSNDELVRSPGEARTSHVVGYLACASLKDLCGAGRAAPNEWNDLKKRPLIYSIDGGIAFREFRVEVTQLKLAVEELPLYLTFSYTNNFLDPAT